MEELTREALRKFFEEKANDPQWASVRSAVKNLGRYADQEFGLGIDYTRHNRKD
jgi:hypothetical protein